MKKGSIIILIIAILVIIAGVAIYMITNQNSTNNSSINLKTMIDTIYKNSYFLLLPFGNNEVLAREGIVLTITKTLFLIL